MELKKMHGQVESIKLMTIKGAHIEFGTISL